MQALFELARTAARSSSTILILGESGTGKELLARAIHAESPRGARPFVAVSCAALTETLLESELFGHEKGAFTGAVTRRRGQVRGGPRRHPVPRRDRRHQRQAPARPAARARGAALHARRRHRVDRRSTCASSPPPTATWRRRVAQGQFREDLFYRLNVIPIRLPPLRERRRTSRCSSSTSSSSSAPRLGRDVDGVVGRGDALLLAHDWPGNVRELRNVLERGMVVAHGRILQARTSACAPRDAACRRTGRHAAAPRGGRAAPHRPTCSTHAATSARRRASSASTASRSTRRSTRFGLRAEELTRISATPVARTHDRHTAPPNSRQCRELVAVRESDTGGFPDTRVAGEQGVVVGNLLITAAFVCRRRSGTGLPLKGIEWRRPMTCPYLKEVLMLYCEACPYTRVSLRPARLGQPLRRDSIQGVPDLPEARQRALPERRVGS